MDNKNESQPIQLRKTMTGTVPEAWDVRDLESITSIKRGRFSPRPRNDPQYYGGNIPFVQTGDITNSDGRVSTYTQTLNEKGLAVSQLFSKGTILITIAANIGHAAILDIDMACPDSLIGIRCKKEVYNEFLNYYLNYIQKRIEYIAPSGAQKNINIEFLSPLKIPLPPLPEQRAIAAVLSTWDKGIDTLQQLITTRKKHKKALTQQLLTGKKRFGEFEQKVDSFKTKYGPLPKDWEYISLQKIAKEISVKNKRSDDLPVLSCTKYRGLVDSLEYFGKQIFSKDTSTYKVVERGQFAYATNHIEEGSIGYQNLHDAALISPMYTAFVTNSKVNDDFLYRLLKTDLFIHIYQASTSASVDRRGSLRWTEFSKIKIGLPSLAEQNKISAVLKTTDRELETLERKLAAMKQQKKGLMQQLLTGKARVKVGE